jgi:hypothetical protein
MQASQADAEDVAFDNDLAFCFELVVVATLLVILALVADPTLASVNVPPIGA